MVKNGWVVGWGFDRHIKNEVLFSLELSLVAEYWSFFPAQTDLQLYAFEIFWVMLRNPKHVNIKTNSVKMTAAIYKTLKN